ncbi:unnamed protein product [Brachionus calyciflorus]|uniref:Uncharacterized protein n=1 Tax=Brachionus calyciflorus TaxID=104777 RepID=A0A814N210_9BILA|nr:unnamed protein product [Brachionus calyciflorus]
MAFKILSLTIIILMFSNEIPCFKNETTLNKTNSKINETKFSNSDEDRKKMVLLEQYFELKSPCPFNLSIKIKKDYCQSTADPLSCFPSTPPNSTFYFPCRFKNLQNIANISGYRNCKSDGTWASSNYFPCLQYMSLVLRNQQIDNDQKIFKLMTICNFIGFSVTIFFVSCAIFVFLSIRSLRCIRNMIHCNMLFTFLFKSTAHIGFYIFILSRKESFWDYNHFLCIVFNVVLNYSLMCSFFWMMIEAVYLITVIVAAYSSNKIKLWWYLITGWSN